MEALTKHWFTIKLDGYLYLFWEQNRMPSFQLFRVVEVEGTCCNIDISQYNKLRNGILRCCYCPCLCLIGR